MSTRMAQEIAEQPDTVRRTWQALAPLRPDLATLLAGRRRVLFAARGTSDNAAIYGRYLLETHAGIAGGLVSPSVATHYRSRLDLSDSVVCSVSQSGATDEIVATQEWARDCGATTIAVTNVDGSPLAAGADLELVTQAGPEFAVPATKSYLGQLVAMVALGTASAPDPAALDDGMAQVPEIIESLLAARAGITDAVAVLRSADYTVVSGRGLLMGTALETALKLEETCLRPVRGYSYADLRHGPISVVTTGMAAVLVAAPDGPMLSPVTGLAHDLGQRGATVVGIGGDDGFAAACDVQVRGPRLPETLAPLGAIVPAQLVVEALARDLGLDPDAPRGLAKVTRTDPTAEGDHP